MLRFIYKKAHGCNLLGYDGDDCDDGDDDCDNGDDDGDDGDVGDDGDDGDDGYNCQDIFSPVVNESVHEPKTSGTK